MTINSLNVFISVYRTGNMSCTAKELYLKQPDVSRCIKGLEKELGVVLFERLSRGLVPTEAGDRLYKYALDIAGLYKDMKREFEKDWLHGKVVIGATDSPGLNLPNVIRAFTDRNPNVVIKTLIVGIDSITQSILDGKMDLALAEGVPEDNMGLFSYQELLTEELAVIVSPDSELAKKGHITIEELAEQPLALREPGAASRVYVDSLFRLHGFEPGPVYESYSIHSLVQAVHAGLGVSILPLNMISYSIESGFVSRVKITGETLTRKHYIVTRKNKHFSPAAAAFIEYCKEYVSSGARTEQP